ncbi:MAG: PHB depolymerase family esterase [Solirubrobacterales bacterium]|nr:PHB depolymerase family esterase [Solirubrobacterales bacterium]
MNTRMNNWRELYAQNRAAIAAAGVPLTAMTLTAPPQPRVSLLDEAGQHAPAVSGGRRLLANPRQHRGAARDRPPFGVPASDRALVHIPRGLDPAVPAPMVVMLHGCTQDPSTFAAATAMNDSADRHGFVVMYPGQPRGRNPQGCWNWFAPEHQQRGAGEPELIAGSARALLVHESRQMVDPRRIFVAGLSSGGAMALILAVCYPDLFTAVAVHSGLPYRAADNLAAAYASMTGATHARAPDGHAIHSAMGQHARPIPSLVIHGTADRTVAPQNSRHILAQLMHANRLATPGTCAHDPAMPTASQRARVAGGLSYTHSQWIDDHGTLMHESIDIDDLGHAWSGGVAGGSYTDPRGPSASEIIWAFFAEASRLEKGPTDAAGGIGPARSGSRPQIVEEV